MGQRVHVVPTGRRVAPFGDAPGDLLILNRPLRQWQAEAFADAGLGVVDTADAPCLVVPDTLFTTGAVLRALVDGAQGRPAVLVLAASAFVDQTQALQPDVEPCDGGLRFTTVRWLAGTEDAAVDVVIDPDEELQTVSRPASMGGDLTLPLAARPVLNIAHWMHLLAANRAAAALPLRTTEKWRLGWDLWVAVLKARSINKWRVLAALTTLGPGCDVHPTAIVEGSVLGAGVTIGPFARVMFSTIGDRATVMANAAVEGAVIGDGALVGQGACVRLSVVYPGAAACMPFLQMSVLGRDVATTTATWPMDANFDGNIKVMLDGTLQDAGTPFLGCAIGHRARIGTGLWIAAGRDIPNDSFIIRDPALTVRRIPVDLPGDGPLVSVDGTLVPLIKQ